MLSVRLSALRFAALTALFSPGVLQASLCVEHAWNLDQIAEAPVLVVGRVLSLERANGPHFTGDPRQSAPPQTITAEVRVLRSIQQPAPAVAKVSERISIRYVGRDGPDFSFCPTPLPELEPAQVLLLPLAASPRSASESWQLIGADGYGMTTRVTAVLGESAPIAHDSRSFITRELVNSFRSGNPVALFTASSLVARQAGYLEPELTTGLETSIGHDTGRWAQILGSMLLTYADRPLTIAEVEAGKTDLDRPNLHGFPLAQLALTHLSGRETAESLVWLSLVADVPGFADEPYHPLFAYKYNVALQDAIAYLSRYKENPALIEATKSALRADRPGSCFLAARLIDEGQKACLPEALDRAMKVIDRPAADADDLGVALRLVLRYGTGAQLRRLAALSIEFRSTNPDYAGFLQRQIAQSFRRPA